MTGATGPVGPQGATGPGALAGDATGPPGSNIVANISGAGTNEFTATGANANVSATETVFASSTNAPVKSFEAYMGVTGSAFHTIASLKPPTGAAQDWAVTAVAVDNVNKANYYRADLNFTLVNSAGVVSMNPTGPAPANVRSGATGAGYQVGVSGVSGPTGPMMVMVAGVTGLVNFSVIGQGQQVQ